MITKRKSVLGLLPVDLMNWGYLMKSIIICVVIFFSFPSVSYCDQEYFPKPYEVEALTEEELDGYICRLTKPPYPGNWDCYTAEEVETWLVENPGGTADVNLEAPCEKCPSDKPSLIKLNDNDVCINLNQPCPDGYTLGNYNGVEGCFKCPQDYQFDVNDGLCLWVGIGHPPPAPDPPTIPTNLKASDGTSDINIIVSWEESSLITDTYRLIRRKSGRNTWEAVAEVNSENGPGEPIKYYDTTAKPVPAKYWYMVKACDQETGLCSNYSNTDLGFRETRPSANIHIIGLNALYLLLLSPEKVSK